jgi:hypothetical protein
VGLTQTPCLRLVMRRSAVGDDRRLRTKVSNSASADTCTHMDSPGPLYAGARLRPGGRASLIRQRSVVQVHLGPPLAPLVSGNTTQRPSRTCSRYSSALRRKEAQMAPSDWVLDELAAVEHAVIAEYLQIAYGLGHRLPDPAPGPAGPAIADAAQKILSMAQFVEMKHPETGQRVPGVFRSSGAVRPSCRDRPQSWVRRDDCLRSAAGGRPARPGGAGDRTGQSRRRPVRPTPAGGGSG